MKDTTMKNYWLKRAAKRACIDVGAVVVCIADGTRMTVTTVSDHFTKVGTLWRDAIKKAYVRGTFQADELMVVV